MNVTSGLAAEWLASTYGASIKAATIRQWARRGHLSKRYDLEEIVAVAQRRGVI